MSDDDTVVYIGLDEWVELAAAVLATAPATIRYLADLSLADSALHAAQAGLGDIDVYPDLPTKAAVLGLHLARNHPLPNGNKRTAFIAMIVFLRRNGATWRAPATNDAVATMLAVAAGTMSVENFTTWITRHILASPPS